MDADCEFNIIRRSTSAYIYMCPLVQFLDAAACFHSSWLSATVSSCAREHAARARPPGILCSRKRNRRLIFLIVAVWIWFKFVFCIRSFFLSFFAPFPRCCTAKRAHWHIPAVGWVSKCCCPWKTPAVTSPTVSRSPPGLLYHTHILHITFPRPQVLPPRGQSLQAVKTKHKECTAQYTSCHMWHEILKNKDLFKKIRMKKMCA